MIGKGLRAGGDDYLTKPVDTEELLLAVGRATERQKLKSEVARLRTEVEHQGRFEFGSIVATTLRQPWAGESWCRGY